MRLTAGSSGPPYLFSSTSWRISNCPGEAVALSASGDMLVVSASREQGLSAGVDGPQSEVGLESAGAAYVFTRSVDHTWSQRSYLKASNPGAVDYFGRGLALSADGQVLAIGAFYEDSAALGFAGDPYDNSVHNAGAVYLY